MKVMGVRDPIPDDGSARQHGRDTAAEDEGRHECRE
jgi:hypothetical protein